MKLSLRRQLTANNGKKASQVWSSARPVAAELRALLSNRTTAASDAPQVQYIFVFSEDLGAVNRKAMSDLFPNCQIFLLRELQFNVTRHAMVPQHTPLNADEVAAMMSAYNIRSKAQLPVLLVTDPVARYFGLRQGDVVKITRRTPTAGIEYFYRVVSTA